MEQQQFVLSEAQSQKLTTWDQEPSIQVLKLDLEGAKQDHDAQMLKIRKWNDLTEVKGTAAVPKVKGRSQVQPKLIRRQAEWRYSALTEPFLGSNKLFSISPATFEDVDGARQNELVLNWQFRTKLNKVKFIDDYVRSNVDEGTVVVRLGWRRHTTMIKQEVPKFNHFKIEDEPTLQLFQQALELSQENPREFNETATPEMKAALEYYKQSQIPNLAEQIGAETVDVEKVIENQPTVEVLNPNNVYIDPSCGGDIDKAMFAVISFETYRAELQKEPNRYKNLDRVNWEGNTPITQPDHVSSTPDTFQLRDLARKKVVAYEYWGYFDINGTGELVPIVVTWIGDVIIRMEENPFPDGKIPLVVVPYLPIKRQLWGESDAELLEDNQKILGAVSRGMIDLLARSANSQQGFAKGMLDPLNKRRFENGQDYEFNPNSNPQNQYIEHKYPELPQSAFMMLNLQNQEAEALTGVKSFAGGVSGDAYGDVAAGIRGVLDAASKREMAILRRLAKGMQEIGNKIIAMNAEFLSEEEVIRVTNDQFITVRREDLQGNFDLVVDIATAEVDDAKSKDLGFMLQTLGNNMDPKFTTMILAEIAELKRMPALAHNLRNFKPEPDPIAEEIRQLELEKLRMEVEELRTQAELNSAKAAEAKSKKDKTDLDYVETETGTKHAREMEKQHAQSQGNQDLVITKALATPKKEGEKAPPIDAAIGYNQLSRETDTGGVPTQLPPIQPEFVGEDIPQPAVIPVDNFQ